MFRCVNNVIVKLFSGKNVIRFSGVLFLAFLYHDFQRGRNRNRHRNRQGIRVRKRKQNKEQEPQQETKTKRDKKQAQQETEIKEQIGQEIRETQQQTVTEWQEEPHQPAG